MIIHFMSYAPVPVLKTSSKLLLACQQIIKEKIQFTKTKVNVMLVRTVLVVPNQ